MHTRKLYRMILVRFKRGLRSDDLFMLGNIVTGVFTPVLAKHTKSFNLIDTLSVGVDRIQRNFEPPQRQVELWRKTQITRRLGEADLLLGIRRRQAGSAQEPAAGSPPAVFGATIS
jgi:hypothetical protein